MIKEIFIKELGAVISAPEIVDDLLAAVSESSLDSNKATTVIIDESLKMISELYPDEFKKLKKKEMDKLRKIIEGGLVEPADKPPDTETSHPNSGESNDNESETPGVEMKSEIDTKEVYLNPSIVARNARLVDPYTKKWIKGTKAKPEIVEFTPFIRHRIGNGELIEVRK